MPEILDRLSQDHRNMARLFDLLSRELKVFKEGDLPDYDLIGNILDYCLHYPETYHHPMEDLLFEKLRIRKPETTDAIGNLKKEHEKLSTLTWRFATAIGNVLEDEQLPRDWFMDVANDFLNYSRNHMQMEEVLFFPAARKNLTLEDWAGLEAAGRKGDDPLFGDEKHEIYKALYQEIMEWGKAGQGSPENGENASHSG